MSLGTADDTGQIVHVARLVAKEGWQWITIAPGQSKRLRARGKASLTLPGGNASSR